MAAQLAASSSGPYTGTIAVSLPAGVLSDTSLLFSSLLELRWKEISIPYVRLGTRLRQDLAIHKFADRDGAFVEGTGRAPLEITARIPLITGLKSGPNEHWQRPLYPFTWRKLFDVCADRQSGVLQHPELGDLTCKLESMSTEWEANVRGGVYCDLAWIESDDTGVDLDQDLSAPSPLASLAAAASDLDLQLTQVDPSIAPSLPVFSQSYVALFSFVRGAVDQTTILQQQYAGRINELIGNARAVQLSLNMADNSNALNWPIRQQTDLMIASGYALQQSLLTKGRPIGFYTTLKDSTLAQVSNTLGANVGDIIILNRNYAGQAVVPSGSVVRFYKAAA